MSLIKEQREIIVKDVLNLLMKGYRPAVIARENADKYFELYGIDESRLYAIVISAFEKTPHDIRQVMLQNRKIKENKELALLKREIVDEVIKIAESDKSTIYLSKVFSNAVEKVCFKRGNVSVASVRKYVAELEPDFYKYYAQNGFVDEEYMVNMAKKIIENNMTRSQARMMPGYEKTMIFIENQYPELYAQIKEIHKSNLASNREVIDSILSKKRALFNDEILNDYFNNVGLLKNIFYEFRVSYAIFCDFINENKELFLKNPNMILTEKELINLFNSGVFQDEGRAISWYNEEAFKKDEYTEYRINRFNEFKVSFALLKNDISKLTSYVKSITSEEAILDNIRKRNQNHQWKDTYKFSHEEIGVILKYCYKYAIYDRDIKRLLNMLHFQKTDQIRMYNASTIDELALVDGIKRLNAFQNLMYDSYSNPNNKKYENLGNDGDSAPKR